MANGDDPGVYYVQQGPPAVAGVPADADAASADPEAVASWVSALAHSLAESDVLVVSVAKGGSIAEAHAAQWNTDDVSCQSKVEVRVAWNHCGGKLVGPGTGVEASVFRHTGDGFVPAAEE